LPFVPRIFVLSQQFKEERLPGERMVIIKSDFSYSGQNENFNNSISKILYTSVLNIVI